MKREQSPFTKKGWFSINNQGFSSLEALLSASLFALLVTALVGAYIYGNESVALAGNRARAVFLAQEGLEASRSLRDGNFSSLTDGIHGLAVSNARWVLSGSQDISDIFTRKVTIASVGDNRKDITSTISWQQNARAVGNVSLVTRLTNWLAAGIGNWTSPAVESVFDFTVENSGNANADAQALAFADNKLYIGRAKSSGAEFFILDVSNPATPLLLGQLELNTSINDIAVSSSYAYLATDDDNAELHIIDISNPAAIADPGKHTSIDLTDSNSGSKKANATAITVRGRYLYMLRDGGDQFLVFNLSNPSAPGDPVGRESTVSGSPNDIIVSNITAYIASGDNNAELQVVDVSNPSAPNKIAAFNLDSGNNGADARSLALVGSTLLIGRNASAAPELYAFSVATPSSPLLTATLELGADVRSLAYDSASRYAFLATNNNSNDIKIVDANDPASPPNPIGQLNVQNSPQHLEYDSARDRIFITSSDNQEEIQIVKPQ